MHDDNTIFFSLGAVLNGVRAKTRMVGLQKKKFSKFILSVPAAGLVTVASAGLTKAEW